MFINLERYIGRIVEIIYLDRTGKLTQRRIEIRAVDGGIVKAYCLMQHGPRVFRLENVLSAFPVSMKGAAI